jgi:SAM-dependent methyltransferase
LFILFRSHQSNFVLFPPKLEGCTVVDLGCGVGRDAFILSKLVGDNGRVIGIDSDTQILDRIGNFSSWVLIKIFLYKIWKRCDFLNNVLFAFIKAKTKIQTPS